MKVGRYARVPLDGVRPAGDIWQGWVESRSGEWVMFVTRAGVPVVFLSRDPDASAALPDDPDN